MLGGAARGIEHRLRRHGYQVVADPEGFIIEGDAGQLHDGERERATAWAAELTRRARELGAMSS